MELAERIHREIDDLVAHIDVFRTYGAGARASLELTRLSEQAGRASAKAEGGRAALSAANEVLAAFGLLVVILVAPRLGLTNLGDTLVPFAAVLFMMYRPLRDLGDARAAMMRGTLALEALSELDDTAEPAEPALTPRGHFPLATLTVEGVGVARDEHVRTSFVASPGEIVAIVGPTGSGKTTLLRALLGLEKDALGSIDYAGEELSRAPVGLARPFAWVPQEAPIVRGTVAENVALTDGVEVSAGSALASIGAERLAEDCGEVRIGSGGRALSGGERRLIGLARALTFGAPVLLLDEPTEGLDELSQARVLAALERLRGKRTIILVTHRQEALRIADRVVSIGAASEPRTSARRR